MESDGTENVEAVKINTKQPRRPFAFRRRSGASLVEMLIAIVVLGMVLISMVGMFVIARTAVFTKEDETAVVLALRYLEELEEEDFSVLTASTGFERREQNYHITATVLDFDEFHARVMVEIKWRGATQGEKTVDMERVISAVGYRNVGEMR